MQTILLNDILTIFGLSVAVLYICHRIQVPTVVGFLITGLLAGPYGLGLVKATEAIELLAEVGVVLLLFVIGLEFSLKSLWKIRKLVLGSGFAQVLLTFLAALMIVLALGRPLPQAVFIGFLVSLSSTAIVMKILQEKAEVESPHGNTSLAILIFQDIIVVPMMLFLPILTGTGGNYGEKFLIFLAEGAGVILLVIIGSRWVVPWILYQVTRTRIPELFLLSVVVLCLLVAWGTHKVGLSLALGAFLAGLTISESEYSHQVIGNFIPFRDVFASFFFVSVGMLLDLRFLTQQPVSILLITVGVLVLKTLIAALAAALTGLPLRTVIIVGMALCQIGEFSFILAKTGIEYHLLTKGMYQMFLAVSVLSMAATPFVMAAAPAVADLFLRLPLPRKLKRGSYPLREPKSVHEKNHLIIIGFGINGKNLARAARASRIPYVIIEMNPEVVRRERAEGEPIYYGDATQEAVLQHARIKGARVIVIVINDPTSTRRVTQLARRMNPKVHIIVRTRFLREMGPLYELGANEVIPEEFETSVEIFSRVLGKYLQPKEEIEKFIAEVRSENYGMFRTLSKEAMSCLDVAHCLPDFEIVSFRVGEKSTVAGKTLAQIALRKKFGVTLLAVSRNAELIYNPDPEIQFLENDLLVVIGQPEKMSKVASLFAN